MRPLLLITLLVGVFFWFAPPYVNDYTWKWCIYMLKFEWFQEVSYVVRFWNWIPTICTLEVFAGNTFFMYLAILVALVLRWCTIRLCGTVIDWSLRLFAFGAAINATLLVFMMYARYFKCPQGKHGGICPDLITEGINSVVSLEWWIDADWLRFISAVMIVSEGWRVRMPFYKIMGYTIFSLTLMQIVTFPLWMLDYRALKRSNDICWWSRHRPESSVIVRRRQQKEKENEEDAPCSSSSSSPDQGKDRGTKRHRRRASLNERLTEPGSGGPIDLRIALKALGVYQDGGRKISDVEYALAQECLVLHPSPESSRPFPTLASAPILGFDLPLAQLIPLFYVVVGVMSGWSWLSWMDAYVRQYCWLDGFLSHVFDNPASFMMHSGPFWGVFVWTIFIWCTEPCFRSTAEIEAGHPPRYFHLFMAWLCSVITSQMVGTGVAMYLAWREFRLHFVVLPSPKKQANDDSTSAVTHHRTIYCEDQSTWCTSGNLSTYILVDASLKMESASTTSPSSPVSSFLASPHVEKKDDPVSSSATTIASRGQHEADANVSLTLISSAYRIVVSLLNGAKDDVRASIQETTDFVKLVMYKLRFLFGFAPLPSPMQNQSFIDWSLLLPLTFFTWVVGLYVCILCRNFEQDATIRSIYLGVLTLVMFYIGLQSPESARVVFAWLCYEPEEERVERKGLATTSDTTTTNAESTFKSVNIESTVSSPSSPSAYLQELGPFADISFSQAFGSVRLNPHLLWTVTTFGLFTVATILVVPDAQFSLPWFSNIYRTVRQNAVDEIHREPNGALNTSLLIATTFVTYILFFGFRLTAPSLSRGMPCFRWYAKFGIVFPLIFIFVVVWPRVVLPCTIELGMEQSVLTTHDYTDMSEAIQQAVQGISKNNTTRMIRPVHPKTHGCVKAIFTQPYYLPPKYRFGLFADNAKPGISPTNSSSSSSSVKSWNAFVRFSNGAHPKRQYDGSWMVQPDSVADVRGMSVKVLLSDNHGEPMILTEEQIQEAGTDRNTQDFVSITSNYFFQDDGKGYAEFVSALATASWSRMAAWIMPKDWSWEAIHTTGKRLRTLYLALLMNYDSYGVVNPLRTEYFSATPYRLGPDVQQAANRMRPVMAVKYRWKPCVPSSSSTTIDSPNVLNWLQDVNILMVDHVNWVYRFLTRGQRDLLSASFDDTVGRREQQLARENPNNFLRINMQNTLDPFFSATATSSSSSSSPTSQTADVCFDLMLQDQRDACVNSLEDSTHIWRGEWVRVGRLEIPQQSFLSTKQLDVCENLTFNPWHSLAAHHPLGDVNKLRRTAYLVAAKTRRQYNRVNSDSESSTGQQQKYTGHELDSTDVLNTFPSTITSQPPTNEFAVSAKESTNLRGNPAMYSYSDYASPFQSLPKKIATVPFQEKMTPWADSNLRGRFIFSSLAATYPQAKLQGEFKSPQDYQYLSLGRDDEVAYSNTNHLHSGRMRRHYHVDEAVWTSDVWWSEQFIKGMNPMLIQRVTSTNPLPSDLLVQYNRTNKQDIIMGDESYKQQLRDVLRRNGDFDVESIAQLAHEGRLFFVDYAMIDDLMTYSDRVLYAPIVLLYLSSSPSVSPSLSSKKSGTSTSGQIRRRTLLPLVIQLERTPGAPLYFPSPYIPGAIKQTSHAMVWLFARMHVSCADSVFHQLISHLLETHLALEPVIIATHRAFTQTHPVFRILHQHFSGTIAINEYGRITLVSDMHANIDDLLVTGLQGALQLMARYYNQSYRFMETLPTQLSRRGFDVSSPSDYHWNGPHDQLPGFLYRDYGLALWYAMRDYVHDVLDPFFLGETDAESDHKFMSDVEISAWFKELYDESSAGIRQLHSITTYKAFVEFVTQIIFQGSAQHAAVNFGQYDYHSFQPARPLFLTKGMPADLSLVDESYVVTSLMPTATASLVLSLFDILSSCCVDTLVEDHAKTMGMVQDDDLLAQHQGTIAFPEQYNRFISVLRQLEGDMRKHNDETDQYYPYLFPSRVPQSASM